MEDRSQDGAGDSLSGDVVLRPGGYTAAIWRVDCGVHEVVDARREHETQILRYMIYAWGETPTQAALNGRRFWKKHRWLRRAL